MASFTFIAGPAGGGSLELLGHIVNIKRKREITQDPLPVEESRVFASYVGVYGNGALEEIQYMFDNKKTLSADDVKAKVQEIVKSNPRASYFYLGGPGVSLYINELAELYPQATIWFAKRKNTPDELEAFDDAYLRSSPVDFKEFISSINDNIRDTIQTKMDKHSLVWTEGNRNVVVGETSYANTGINNFEKDAHENFYFFRPTELAVYFPGI